MAFGYSGIGQTSTLYNMGNIVTSRQAKDLLMIARTQFALAMVYSPSMMMKF